MNKPSKIQRRNADLVLGVMRKTFPGVAEHYRVKYASWREIIKLSDGLEHFVKNAQIVSEPKSSIKKISIRARGDDELVIYLPDNDKPFHLVKAYGLGPVIAVTGTVITLSPEEAATVCWDVKV